MITGNSCLYDYQATSHIRLSYLFWIKSSSNSCTSLCLGLSSQDVSQKNAVLTTSDSCYTSDTTIMKSKSKEELAAAAEAAERIEMEPLSEESEEDEDDEVFINKNHENGSAKKPLIKSKKNGKNSSVHTEIRTGKPHAKRCCGPICCIFLALKTLMGIIAITIVLTNYFTHSSFLFWNFGSSGEPEIGKPKIKSSNQNDCLLKGLFKKVFNIHS